jgi:hypothetical protein
MPFVYPPVTLPLFAPFTFISLTIAPLLWLALEVFALIVLLQLWRREFLPSVPIVPLAFAMAFGFNAASMWSLKTGNVAVFEALILWIGFASYTKGKRVLSVVSLAAGSLFKLAPAAFLFLPEVGPGGWRRWSVRFLALLGLAVLVAVPVVLGPAWARGFLQNLPGERPFGYVNPSAIGLFDSLRGQHGASSSGAALSLWAVYAIVLLGFSAPALKRAWVARDPVLWVMTATPLYVLLHPRPMIYTYLLAIPAMFYFLGPMLSKLGGHTTVAILLGAQAFIIPGLGLDYENPWTANLPFFLLLGIWITYALGGARSRAGVKTNQIKREGTRESQGTADPRAVAAIIVAACAGIAWFLFAELKVAGRWGFSLDDSWIYATIARNIATGHGYSFNPGETIGGATGPLYAFILAGLYSVFHDLILPAKILGALCLIASALLTYRAMLRIDPRDPVKPLLAGLLVALSPSLLWGSLSGMEIPVYLLLACLGLDAYVAGRWPLALLFWSLGVWVRPDGVFLAAIGAIARPRTAKRGPVAVLALAFLVIALFFVFNRVVGDHWFPNSAGVKAHPGSNFASTLLGSLRHWGGLWGLPFGPNRVGEHAIVLLPALVAGAVMTLRTYPALGLYALGIPIAFAIAGVPWSAHGRYILYVVPFGVILALIALGRVARRIFPKQHVRALIVLGVLCLAWQAYEARVKGILHGWNGENINDMHRFFAERVAGATAPGDTVAVNDVGAMGYFSRCYVVDLVGLVSERRAFPENLQRYHPKLLAIFPDWYSSYGVRDPVIDNIVFYSPDSMYKWTPVAGVGLRRNTIAARDQMILFQRIGAHETGPADVPVYWR